MNYNVFKFTDDIVIKELIHLNPLCAISYETVKINTII